MLMIARATEKLSPFVCSCDVHPNAIVLTSIYEDFVDAILGLPHMGTREQTTAIGGSIWHVLLSCTVVSFKF